MNDTLKVAGRIGAELGAAKAEVEEVVVVYDPDSRSYEEHTLSVSATKGSRKSLGIQNAKLKSKIGRLCIQNNELRKELDKHSSDLEAAYKAGLSARGFAGIPEDWSVTKDGESILLRHEKGSAVELNSNGSLCDRVIYGFISDLLYAAPIAQTAPQPEQSEVDTFELPELGRGLNPLDASAHWITAYRAATGLTLAEAREEGRRRRAALSAQGAGEQ